MLARVVAVTLAIVANDEMAEKSERSRVYGLCLRYSEVRSFDLVRQV